MRAACIALALLLPSSALAGGQTWNVALDGSDEFSSIQDAIDASDDGDTIVVAGGTYAESLDFTNKAVLMQGAGIGVTVVSGTGTGSTIYIGVDFGGEVTLTDMTVAGGDARTGDGDTYGGCLNVVDASPTIARVEFRECAANRGGGVSLRNSSANLTNVEIHDCLADEDGAGLYVEDGSVTVEWLRSRDNAASQFGGGVTFFRGLHELRDSWLHDNTADWGAGLMLREGAPTVERVTVTDNVACDGGGGIAVWATDADISGSAVYRNRLGGLADGCNEYPGGQGAGIWTDAADLTLTASTLALNDSGEGDGGGVGTTDSSTLLLERVIIANNNGADSAGIATGAGGAAAEADATLTLRRSRLSGNTAVDHSGGALLETTALFEGVLILDNEAADWNSGGAVQAIPYDGHEVTLRNNIFASNRAGNGTVSIGNVSVSLLNNTFFEEIAEVTGDGVVHVESGKDGLDLEVDIRNNIVSSSSSTYDIYAPSPSSGFLALVDYNHLEGDFGGHLSTPGGVNNVTGTSITFASTDPAGVWENYLRLDDDAAGTGDPTLGEPEDPGAFGGLYATVWDGGDLDGDGVTVWQFDCNDDDATVLPGAAELCNCRDDDCDTDVDEGCAVIGPCFDGGLPPDDDDDTTDDDDSGDDDDDDDSGDDDDDDDDSGDDDDSAPALPAAGCLVRCDTGAGLGGGAGLLVLLCVIGRRRERT